MSTKVVIAMATYNGVAFLEEQVASLRAQDHADWTLLVRDDGSSDGTHELLARLARADPRLRVLEPGARLGASGNFAAVLREAREAAAEYVFPCDQDDVWLPHKISSQLAAVAALEARHGRATPLLVHSDLQVVDVGLRPLHPSFLRHQGIAHEATGALQVLLVQNFVTGCASLLNRALLELALPVPGCCIMHDWWLAQCAAAAGRIGFVSEPLLLYRQHGSNAIGATGAWGGLNPFHAAGRMRLARNWEVARQTLDQAQALHDRLVEHGTGAPAARETVRAFARCREERPWRRLATLRRLGIHRHRPLGTALLMVRMALMGWGAA